MLPFSSTVLHFNLHVMNQGIYSLADVGEDGRRALNGVFSVSEADVTVGFV